MFEQSLVVAGPANRWSMVSSLTIQATGVCALLAVPLIWVEQLPVMPPLPPQVFAPPKLPEAMKVFTSGVIRAMAPRFTTPPAFQAPVRIPSSVNIIRDLVEGPDLPVTTSLDQLGSPYTGGVPNSLGAAPPPPQAQPKPEAAKAAPPTPTSIPVHSAIQASKLVHQVKPPYPPIAMQTRTQGVVKLHAIIARDGSIQQLQVMSGPPLLIQAAVDAVKQWRYSPTLLNGQPVEVVTQIDVNFLLGGR